MRKFDFFLIHSARFLTRAIYIFFKTIFKFYHNCAAPSCYRNFNDRSIGTIYALINRHAVMIPDTNTRILELSVRSFVRNFLVKRVMACVYWERYCRESLSRVIQMDTVLKSEPQSYFLTYTFTPLLSLQPTLFTRVTHG